MATILVTCAGSGVGQSVVDSLNLVDEQHTVLGVDSNRNVYGHHFCDRFFTVPSIYSKEYLNTLLELCVREKVDLIIPGHDHELSLLSEHLERFQQQGIEVLVSGQDIIEISRNKYEWFRFFGEKGCPIVPTFRVSEFKHNADLNIFPAIVKPCGGSASQGITIVDTMKQLDDLDDDDIIQPYLFPLPDDENYDLICQAVKNRRFLQMSEISIQLIFTKESEFAGIFISKNVLKNGVPVYVNPIQPDEFEYLDDIMRFVPILIRYKVKGPVNIQGRITERGLVCFEMNMRFTGITGNRAQLGFNEVEFLVNNFLGKKSVLHGYSLNKLGVRQVACTTIPRKVLGKKIVSVYGAGGFLGSSFVHELLKSDLCRVVNLICRDSSYNKLKQLFTGNKVFVCKTSDPLTETLLCQSDVVVNFVGALAFKPQSEIYDAIIYQYEQAQRIMKANVPLVINVSSQSLYDQAKDIAKSEEDSVVLDDTYSLQKRLAELFFEESNRVSPLMKVISLRFSRIVGKHYSGVKPIGFFAHVVEALMNDREIVIQNPENKINLLDINDSVRAIIYIINNTDWNYLPKILNVGNENISIGSYCDKVVNMLGDMSKARLIQKGTTREVTLTSMLDSSAFIKLGWKPLYSIDDIIRQMISSYRS